MRIRWPFAGGLAVLLLASAYIGLTPLHISMVNDKVLHFVVFFLITLTLYWTVDIPRRLLFKLVFAAAAVLAVGSEVLQSALPNERVFDPVDIAANFLGSALAMALCTWYHRRMLERKRQQKLQGYGLVNRDETDDVELGDASHHGQELGVIAEDDDDDGAAWDNLENSNGEAAVVEADREDSKPKD